VAGSTDRLWNAFPHARAKVLAADDCVQTRLGPAGQPPL